jgi:cysteine desulfuration protein SufE
MTIQETQRRIIEEMAAHQNLTDKYAYLIGVGRSFQVSEQSIRTEENLLRGCQSNVWLQVVYGDGKITIRGDSDSLIIKGMIGLLIRVLNDRQPADILGTDLYFLEETGLSAHLSPARSDGLAAIIGHIRSSVRNAVQ